MPVIVVDIAAGTDGRLIAAAALPADALPGVDDGRWVVVDPPPATLQALHAVAGREGVRPAWAIAIALHDPNLDSTSRLIFEAARQTLVVSDPDFGLVAYALFDSADEARASLGAAGC